jgi:transcriptional regulator with XRE-family HTH domain
VPATYVQSLVWIAPFLRGSVSPVTDGGRQEFLNALGATILALRVERGPALAIYTQGDLGAAIGVSSATVLRWENGDGAPPDAWEVRRLCEVFACEPDELIRPQPMSAREREILRRAGRQLRRTIDREREAG